MTTSSPHVQSSEKRKAGGQKGSPHERRIADGIEIYFCSFNVWWKQRLAINNEPNWGGIFSLHIRKRGERNFPGISFFIYLVTMGMTIEVGANFFTRRIASSSHINKTMHAEQRKRRKVVDTGNAQWAPANRTTKFLTLYIICEQRPMEWNCSDHRRGSNISGREACRMCGTKRLYSMHNWKEFVRIFIRHTTVSAPVRNGNIFRWNNSLNTFINYLFNSQTPAVGNHCASVLFRRLCQPPP